MTKKSAIKLLTDLLNKQYKKELIKQIEVYGDEGRAKFHSTVLHRLIISIEVINSL